MILKDTQLVAKCMIAASLQEGLSILDSQFVDLIILDPNLPDSKGLATLKRLKKAIPGQTGDRFDR